MQFQNLQLIFFRDGVVYALQRRGRILLADDMGLGKTIQALAVASAYQKDWPLLIVCPSSVRFSWRSAIFRWLPSVPEEDVIVITSGKIQLSQKVSTKLSQGQFCVYVWVNRRYTGCFDAKYRIDDLLHYSPTCKHLLFLSEFLVVTNSL